MIFLKGIGSQKSDDPIMKFTVTSTHPAQEPLKTPSDDLQTLKKPFRGLQYCPHELLFYSSKRFDISFLMNNLKIKIGDANLSRSNVSKEGKIKTVKLSASMNIVDREVTYEIFIIRIKSHFFSVLVLCSRGGSVVWGDFFSFASSDHELRTLPELCRCRRLQQRWLA